MKMFQDCPVINNNFNKIDKLCKLGFPPFLPSSTNLISVQVICDIISDPFFFNTV